MMIFLFTFSTILFLAFANGSNDNFKGVSTLFGSGLTTFQKALMWATLTTTLGAVSALIISKGLLATFSGKGLVPDSVISLKSFSLAIVLSASLTVMLATKIGFPISTTHALTGALVGAGILASPEGVNFENLKKLFFWPLILSPIISLGMAAALYSLMNRFNRTVTESNNPTSPQKWIERLHYLSAGTVCFARALNDTPKIAAILLLGGAISPYVALGAVTLFMALGGWLNSAKIAETMSQKITQMTPSQGLIGNLTTGFLVIFASKLGLPVSTTHVACGSLFGIGIGTGQASYKMISGILLAWIITLPVAAVLSGLCFLLLRSTLAG